MNRRTKSRKIQNATRKVNFLELGSTESKRVDMKEKVTRVSQGNEKIHQIHSEIGYLLCQVSGMRPFLKWTRENINNKPKNKKALHPIDDMDKLYVSRWKGVEDSPASILSLKLKGTNKDWTLNSCHIFKKVFRKIISWYYFKSHRVYNYIFKIIFWLLWENPKIKKKYCYTWILIYIYRLISWEKINKCQKHYSDFSKNFNGKMVLYLNTYCNMWS